MKYGVIVFKESENLGDDIQSYAAKRFLPKIDYYIERESLDLFVPNEKEKVKVIMNGWFLHYKYTLFPSPYIDPLYISTHFSSYKTFGIENEYIEVNKDYLKEYEPIGCRDIQTQKLLEKYDIKNYFSGCVTLTIDKFDIKKTEKDYICCVDVSKKISDYLKKKSKICYNNSFDKHMHGRGSAKIYKQTNIHNAIRRKYRIVSSDFKEE